MATWRTDAAGGPGIGPGRGDPMDANRPEASPERAAQQRAGARRTAIAIGLVASVIYVAFILRGVLNA